MKTKILAGALAAVFLSCASVATAGLLVPIPSVPGSTDTYAEDITRENLIVGSYSTEDRVRHGFFGTLDGKYTTFDVPNGGGSAIGVDERGDIIGIATRSPACPYTGCEFLRRPDGTINFLSMKRERIDGAVGDIISKEFVGDYSYVDENHEFHRNGFRGKGTKYIEDITLPFDTTYTRVRGLASDGTISGWFADQFAYNGFVLKDGMAKAYGYPDDNAAYTEFERMNSKGRLAGAWLDELNTFSKAFLFDLEKESFLPIDITGTFVFATAINDSGLATVLVDNTSYLYCPKKKSCPIQSPNAREMPERWISAAGYSHTLPCNNGCRGLFHSSRTKVDRAAVREAVARDPVMQRELGLPFRP